MSEQLYWGGNLALVLQAVIITLAVTRHPWAPKAAAAGGISLALGFAAAHWLPTWSSVSDSFVEGGSPWYSLVASALEIFGALALAAAGIAALRGADQGASSSLDSDLGALSR